MGAMHPHVGSRNSSAQATVIRCVQVTKKRLERRTVGDVAARLMPKPKQVRVRVIIAMSRLEDVCEFNGHADSQHAPPPMHLEPCHVHNETDRFPQNHFRLRSIYPRTVTLSNVTVPTSRFLVQRKS